MHIDASLCYHFSHICYLVSAFSYKSLYLFGGKKYRDKLLIMHLTTWFWREKNILYQAMMSSKKSSARCTYFLGFCTFSYLKFYWKVLFLVSYQSFFFVCFIFYANSVYPLHRLTWTREIIKEKRISSCRRFMLGIATF